MKINLTPKEFKALKKALTRVGIEVKIQDSLTSTSQTDLFLEDLRLILAEFWIILKTHGRNI